MAHDPVVTAQVDSFIKAEPLEGWYTRYSWRKDNHPEGFVDILALEIHISEQMDKGQLTLQDIKRVMEWGIPHIKTKIVGPVGALAVNRLPRASEAAAWIDSLESELSGCGTAYITKMLRFIDPSRFGALDNRLVRVFGKGDPHNQRYPWLNLRAHRNNNRWVVRRVKSWPQQYQKWIDILHHIANKLPPNCPHPEEFVAFNRRNRGVWAIADVEMALFSFASNVTRAGKK